MALRHRSIIFAVAGIWLICIAPSIASEDTTSTCSNCQDTKPSSDETTLLQSRVVLDKESGLGLVAADEVDEDQSEAELYAEEDDEEDADDEDEEDADADAALKEGSDDSEELEMDEAESLEALSDLDNAVSMDSVLEDYDEADELEVIIAHTVIDEDDEMDEDHEVADSSERRHRRRHRRHRRHRRSRRSRRASAAARWRAARARAARAVRAARARAARARRAVAARARAAAARARRAAAAAAARARARVAALARAAKAKARAIARAVAAKLKKAKEALKRRAQAIARAAAAKARKIRKALADAAKRKAKAAADAIKRGMHPRPILRVGGATPAVGRVDLDMWLLARYASGAEQQPPRQLPAGWTVVKHHKVGSGHETDSLTIFKKTGTNQCAVGFECVNPTSTDTLQIFLSNWFRSRLTGDYAKCGMSQVNSGFSEEFHTLFRAGWWHSEALPYLNSHECSGGIVSTGLSLGAVLADMFAACTNNAVGRVNLPGGRRRRAGVSFPRHKVNSLYTFHGLPVSKTQITNGQARDGVFPGKRFFSQTSTRVDPTTATGCVLLGAFFPLPVVTPWCGNKHPKVDAVQIFDPEFSVYTDGSAARRRRASMILTPARSSASATTPTGTGKLVDFLTFYKLHSTPLFDRIFDSLYGFKFQPTKGAALFEASANSSQSLSPEELDQQELEALQKQIAAVESSLLEADDTEELSEDEQEQDQDEHEDHSEDEQEQDQAEDEGGTPDETVLEEEDSD